MPLFRHTPGADSLHHAENIRQKKSMREGNQNDKVDARRFPKQGTDRLLLNLGVSSYPVRLSQNALQRFACCAAREFLHDHHGVDTLILGHNAFVRPITQCIFRDRLPAV